MMISMYHFEYCIEGVGMSRVSQGGEDGRLHQHSACDDEVMQGGEEMTWARPRNLIIDAPLKSFQCKRNSFKDFLLLVQCPMLHWTLKALSSLKKSFVEH